MAERPTPGQREDRSADALTVDGRRVHGVVPYGVQSRDMGGWSEIIEPGALRHTNFDELRAVVDHQGVPLATYPRTLTLEDRADGLGWSFEPPRSRQDVVEAIERGDMRAGSWRMVVGRDRWEGDVRHVEEIRHLYDVSIVGAERPIYPSAAIELRSRPEEATVPEIEAPEATTTQTLPETPPEATEARSEPAVTSGGRLRVEGRTSAVRRGLADEFRARGFLDRGFPGSSATMPWEEYEQRAVTWSASVDVMNQVRRMGGPLGLDQRYAWPAFGRVGVGADQTSVLVVQQTSRALASATNVVRAIDATTAKPETGSGLNVINVPLKQVANMESNIPNIYMLQPAITSIVEGDLRLAINAGLDKLVLDQIATAGFQAPGTDILLVSIRKAITTLRGAGYNPDTVILTPADDAALDVLVSGISGGTADFVFGPGVDSESSLFGCERRISMSIPASAVVDSQAFGKLYASPVSLARFENLSGTTNTSNIRLELNAAFGLERVAAAVRIAAS